MSLTSSEQQGSVDFVFDGQLPKSPAPALECPRCRSINTKFCYYNNYNKSQPRHFCKACKRHWTKGGILRNLPVGGGRKNKRQKKKKTSIMADSNSTSSQRQSLDPLFLSNQNNNLGQSLVIPSPSSTVQVDPMMNINNINLGSFSFGSCFMGFSELTSRNNLSSSDVSYNVYEEDSKMGLIMPTSNFMDMQKYCWNLEDIDTLVSSHELNIP